MGVLVQTCITYHLESGNYVCDVFDLVDAVLLPPSAQGNIDLLIQGGFDPDIAQLAFTGTILMWVIGISIGLVIGHIRKLRV